jgi:hypothetical protein
MGQKRLLGGPRDYATDAYGAFRTVSYTALSEVRLISSYQDRKNAPLLVCARACPMPYSYTLAKDDEEVHETYG